MTYKNIIHWKPVEESEYITTFEGSLQPKMSLINIVNDILDLLKCLIRWITAVQSDVLSRIAIFWSYFTARMKSLVISQIMEGF